MRSGGWGGRRQWLNQAPTLPCAHKSSAGNAASLKRLPFDSVIPSLLPFRSICKSQYLGQGHAEFPFFPDIFPQDLPYCRNLGIIPWSCCESYGMLPPAWYIVGYSLVNRGPTMLSAPATQALQVIPNTEKQCSSFCVLPFARLSVSYRLPQEVSVPPCKRT